MKVDDKMKNNFVVDNSVVMSWLFKDEVNRYADAVLDRLTEATAYVPVIWPLEVVNVLLTAERRNRIRQADSVRFLTLLLQLPIIVEDDSPKNLMGEILALGRAKNLSSYDASYLDLAMRKDCPIATLDSKIIEAARDIKIAVLSF
jgi:predicted nucleic acid-binding protein